MFVILKNISTAVSSDNLKSIVNSAIESSFLHKKGHLISIKIIRLVNRSKHEVDRYAIIRLDSENTEKYLINALNRRIIDGRTVLVAKYIVRHWTNDRRTTQPDVSVAVNKRKADRRRKHLKTEVICEVCEKIKLQTTKSLDLIWSWFSNSKH
jgi:hypothetical protein